MSKEVTTPVRGSYEDLQQRFNLLSKSPALEGQETLSNDLSILANDPLLQKDGRALRGKKVNTSE